jgi:Rod binding domain-containing protein
MNIYQSSLASQTSALDLQSANVAKRNEAGKVEKAGKDFESILLGNWLQSAQSSFATVPGGDEDDDGSSGKDQFQGIAMQALATSLTAHGGIGIAKMISEHLRQSEPATPVESTPGLPVRL